MLLYFIDIDFKFFHLRPKNPSISNILALSALWRSYITQIAQRDFYFEIETFNNGAVRIYV